MDPAPVPGWRLETRVDVAATPDVAWGWVSDPRKLNQVTPAWFHLALPEALPKTELGARFRYRLRLGAVQVPWVSRVTHCAPPGRLTYVQERGPYRYFLHDHHVQAVEGGSRITDIVEYRLWGGRLTHVLGVRAALRSLFRTRAARLLKELGEPGAARVTPP